MPVLVPIVAAGAGYFATGAVVGSMALGTIASVTVGVAVGAVVGAAVGAIGTLVTGGDLKENALTGAFAGALGGGFGGFGAAKASGSTMWSAGSAESQMMSSPTAMEYAATATGKANTSNALAAVGAGAEEGALGGLTTGEGMALSTGIQGIGSLMESYGAADAAKEQREWSKEDADLAFQRDLEKIKLNHQNAMEQIKAQGEAGGGGDGIEIAKLNNAGAASRQDDQQAHETDFRKGGWEREDQVRDRFNESVTSVPINAFERPVFDFAEATVFENVATGGMNPEKEVA